jgi:Ni,Fe-hydrogenase I cytochrome b subunit
VIVGSSAGALIGLQFVVMTLMAERQIRSTDAGGAFGSPTVVHFSVVLFLSALLRAPWQSITSVLIMLGLFGVGGLVYGVIVLRRMLRQTVYQPVAEDWLFHLILPFVSYLLLAVTPLWGEPHARLALFFVAAASLLLLFTGIHNAWDSVTYQVFNPDHGKTPSHTPGHAEHGKKGR